MATSVQTSVKPFICGFCGKCFIRAFNLKTHILVHTGDKPYKCDICGKCFTLFSNLNGHILVHTGEKPYSLVLHILTVLTVQ